MIAIIAAAALSIGGLVGFVLYLRPIAGTPADPRGPFGALPLLLWWLAALLVPSPVDPIVKGSLLLGMLLAVLAVGLWQSGYLPPYAAYAQLLIAYFLYGAAVASVPASQPTWWGLLLLIPAALLAYWFRDSLAELWWSVLLFGFVLALALWHALNWVIIAPAQLASWLALLAVTLLILAHLGQALAAFRPVRLRWDKAAWSLVTLGHFALVWMLWLLVIPIT